MDHVGAKQAGIEWFNAAASTSGGSLSTALLNEGYVGLGNDNLTYRRSAS